MRKVNEYKRSDEEFNEWQDFAEGIWKDLKKKREEAKDK